MVLHGDRRGVPSARELYLYNLRTKMPAELRDFPAPGRRDKGRDIPQHVWFTPVQNAEEGLFAGPGVFELSRFIFGEGLRGRRDKVHRVFASEPIHA